MGVARGFQPRGRGPERAALHRRENRHSPRAIDEPGRERVELVRAGSERRQIYGL